MDKQMNNWMCKLYLIEFYATYIIFIEMNFIIFTLHDTFPSSLKDTNKKKRDEIGAENQISKRQAEYVVI